MDKLNKVIIIMMIIAILLIGIVTALLLNDKNSNKYSTDEEVKTQIGEVIYDECTDDYEELENEIIETNTKQEKISPNCKLILTKYYNGCKDSINEYLNVSEELVNCTKEELQNKYKDWEIKEFSSNQVVLFKEFEGECGEHYLLKDNEGKINIYKINENGKQELYEKTEIATDYLPQRDKETIVNGLKVNGKEKLNEIIESFE